MKPPLRTESVGTKISEVEFALLEERARGAGLRFQLCRTRTFLLCSYMIA